MVFILIFCFWQGYCQKPPCPPRPPPLPPVVQSRWTWCGLCLDIPFLFPAVTMCLQLCRKSTPRGQIQKDIQRPSPPPPLSCRPIDVHTVIWQISQISTLLFIMSTSYNAIRRQIYLPNAPLSVSLCLCVSRPPSLPPSLCWSLLSSTCPLSWSPSTAWHRKRSFSVWRTFTKTPWNLHRGRVQGHVLRTRQRGRWPSGRSGPVNWTLSCPWPEASSD